MEGIIFQPTMYAKPAPLINKIHPVLWQVLCASVSIAAFALILLNRSPNLLRPLSMSLRTGFGLVIPAAALALYLIYRIPGRIGELLSMASTICLFAFPLAGLWASGQTQSIVISGLVPLSDAANYYIDGLRIISGMEISHFSAMRPFFPGFLSLLLGLTDRNLMFSLAIVTAVAAFSFYLTSREVQRTHGAEAAAFLLIILFLYFRAHSGTSMSETLGVALGALGIGLIWRGIGNRIRSLAIFGLFVMALALNTRPGTMFILPALLLWISWIFRRSDERISPALFCWGTAAILGSFLLNSLLIRYLAGPSGTAFSNFSWALYGLASGGNYYTYVFETHPELLQLQDPQQSQTIYRLALDLIVHHPTLLIKGALYYWSLFFSNTWYNAFSFIGGENANVNSLARWGMYVLCVLGFVKWFRKPGDAYAGLAAIAALSVLASVPFVPPTDGYRVRLYAATIIAFGLLPGMGVALIVEGLGLKFFTRPDPEIESSSAITLFSGILVFTILFAALISRQAAQVQPAMAFTCPDLMDKGLIRFDAGTSINVIRQNNVMLDWMPSYHQSLFKRNIHSLADINLIVYLEKLVPPKTIFYSLDYLSNRGAMIVISTDLLPDPGTYLGMCGKWETDPDLTPYDIFNVHNVIDPE